MTERRTPRAFLQSSAPDDDASDAPAVSPALVEWLEGKFPLKLSRSFDPSTVLAEQARQVGIHEVIDLLRNLTHHQQQER